VQGLGQTIDRTDEVITMTTIEMEARGDAEVTPDEDVKMNLIVVLVRGFDILIQIMREEIITEMKDEVGQNPQMLTESEIEIEHTGHLHQISTEEKMEVEDGGHNLLSILKDMEV